MEGLLLLAVLVLGVFLLNMHGRMKALEARLGELLDRLGAGAVPAAVEEPEAAPPKAPAMAYASKRSARVTGDVAPVKEAPERVTINVPPAPEPAAQDQGPKRSTFEDLVGGKLPIWVGGISLVFAGFFLVRYTIDAGLLGPGARSVLAALFALLLIAGSRWGGRLPKIGDSFTADPRIAQSLAGAGVAILYGTLYMAAEIYGLIGVPLAFALLIATTILAFTLSLRHGPPTALMGLVGGFAAPWVAGLGPDNVPVLLLYLGVFLAGLFGLALWRRWLWLLLLASGGGALWTIGLIVAADSALPLVGLFVLVAGGAAVLVGDRFADKDPRLEAMARYAPMGLALVQLAMLLPRLEFGPSGWALYAALSAMGVALAWRDSRHLPTLFGALLVCLMPLAMAWDSDGATPIVIAATLGLGLLFGLPAHLKARIEGSERPYWAMLALVAQAVPFLAAYATGHDSFGDRAWGAICALLVLPAAWIAWQWRKADGRSDRLVQLSAAALALTMTWLALSHVVPSDYLALATMAVAAAAAAWAARVDGSAMQKLAAVPLVIGILMLLGGSFQFVETLGTAMSGQQLMLSRLPQIGHASQWTLAPSLALIAIAAMPHFALGPWMRRLAWLVGGTGLAAFAWLIAKQLAAIDSPSQFISLGLAERVVMTQLLFLGGWLALRRATGWHDISAKLGAAAIAIALFRLFWFDLLVFNPVMQPQALGPAPIANLGTVHLALVALWLWLLARLPLADAAKPAITSALQGASLGAMALATLVTVRQLVQGNLISGASIETGENYLYSVALLALAIGWLVIGIRSGMALLRLAGLALLTVVTLKVFLIDAAALEGILRILSFMGLGIALIGIGWAYGRVMRAGAKLPETA